MAKSCGGGSDLPLSREKPDRQAQFICLFGFLRLNRRCEIHPLFACALFRFGRFGPEFRRRYGSVQGADRRRRLADGRAGLSIHRCAMRRCRGKFLFYRRFKGDECFQDFAGWKGLGISQRRAAGERTEVWA